MPQIGACCELSRCEPVERRVRSVGVVVDPPLFDDQGLRKRIRGPHVDWPLSRFLQLPPVSSEPRRGNIQLNLLHPTASPYGSLTPAAG
jgi:hypothetical protein